MPKRDDFDYYERGLIDWDDIETSLAEIWRDVTTGWGPLIVNALSDIESLMLELPRRPVITDIKQKYGSLRIYYHPADERIDEIIDRAEAEAEETCIECGRKERVQGRWYPRALCPMCLLKMFRVDDEQPVDWP